MSFSSKKQKTEVNTMSENIVHMLGRLVEEPKLNYTQSGSAMAIIRIATDRRFISKDKKNITDYHKLIIWNQAGELAAQTLHKGNRIFVTGSIQNDNYTDKNGVKHYGYAINVDRFSYIERKNDNKPEQQNSAPVQNQETQQAEVPAAASTPLPDYPDKKATGFSAMGDGEVVKF